LHESNFLLVWISLLEIFDAFVDSRFIGCFSHRQLSILSYGNIVMQQNKSASICMLHCGEERHPISFFNNNNKSCICGEFNNK